MKGAEVVISRELIACVGSLSENGAPMLSRVRGRTLESFIPVVEGRVRDFLGLLLTVRGPVHVLRIKATINFSTILVTRCTPGNYRVIAVRGCRGEVPVTGTGFRETKGRRRVALLRNSTARVLPRLRKRFSVVFVSTTGKRCVGFVPRILHLLGANKILISSGILRSNSVVRSRCVIRHEGHAVCGHVERCLCRLARSSRLIATIVPVNSKVAISAGL